MTAVEANNITIEYEDSGSPSNPAIMLIRGLGTQLIDWPKEFVDGLVDQYSAAPGIRKARRFVGKYIARVMTAVIIHPELPDK